MKPTIHHIIRTLLFSLCHTNFAHCLQPASAYDQTCNVTYQGVSKLGVDYFFGLHYGEDTGGARRFKPPIPYVPKHGSAVDATIAGPACPQPKGDSFTPLYISNVTEISEDCLHLNVYRPHGTKADAKLTVFVYIHGGSFYVGSKDDLVVQPEGLIRRSVDIGIPMIQVNINYRLGGMSHTLPNMTRVLWKLTVYSLRICPKRSPEGSTQREQRPSRPTPRYRMGPR